MIRYALRCDADHGFESWFADAAAFDTLAQAGQLSCPLCGSAKISKALMVPSVRPARNAPPGRQGTADDVSRPAAAEAAGGHSSEKPRGASGQATGQAAAHQISERLGELEQAIAALRREVEQNSDYVGKDFATEARRIHAGEAAERPIYGEAKADEARQLIEEGVQIMPLPFIPRRKTN
ncbi:DUF1178 family protein [Xinfangfangia sp. D13-10-4-6]|uniref:DUF1178 family protein n=1 Tax=Pseudogemmobacter hezensis TaxID=2737662 RepID=UPI0015570EA5|nr:DUF1178 family protein [Pseudogemmobacter hezensis]NPD13737.1 DUF1178 family protein [Pseudogemmobacter hezensis]